MKNKVILRNIISRTAAAAFFLLVCGAVFLFSLGILKLPFTGPGPSVVPPAIDSAELSRIEETIKNLTEGQSVSGITLPPEDSSAGSGTSDAVTSDAGTSDAGTDGPADPPSPSYMTLGESLKLRYRQTWDDWGTRSALAKVGIPDLPAEYTLGNEKTLTLTVPLTYEDNGLQFKSYEKRIEQRAAVELYMGYIIVDGGKGDAVSPFPEAVTDPETGAVSVLPAPAEERKQLTKTQRLFIYASDGSLLGIYPASDVVPANTRDTQDRALFTYGNRYYYIDPATGSFIESDYIDERDGRGMYFDYDPDFGKADSAYKKWSTFEDVLLSYTIDTYYVYVRFVVDHRLARQVYEADPEFAEIVAKPVRPGAYYNRPFAEMLKIAKRQIEADSRAALTATAAPVTTLSPEITLSPDVTGPEGTGTGTEGTQIPAESGTGEAPGTGTASPDASTTDPGATTIDHGASTIDPGAQTTLPDVQTTVPGASTEVPDVTTSYTGATTTDPGASTEVPDVTGGAPDITTAVPDITTAVPDVTGGSPDITTSSPDESGGDITTEPEPTEPAGSTEEPHKIIDVSLTFPSWRFIYGRTEPVPDPEKTTTLTQSTSVYMDQTISWATQYPYAKAYAMRQGRGYTVDDNGFVRIVNAYGGTAVYENRNYYPEHHEVGTYVRSFYIEPFERDISRLGHFFYDNGYIRMRHVEVQTYNPNIYITDEDILVDLYGNRYELPAGFELVAYSDGVILLKRGDLYGCYHVDGYWVAQPQYSYAEPFVEGLCVLGLSDGTKGVIDTSGKIVIPFRYTRITSASSGIIACYSEQNGWEILSKVAK